MKVEHNSFEYSYSAKQQDEIKKIRDRYQEPPKKDRITLLRELDASVTKKGACVSLCFGIIGVLIMGLGMSIVMTDIPDMLGIGESLALFIGIAVGFFGMILAAIAYPLYNRITEKERKRIAPQILALTDELIK